MSDLLVQSSSRKASHRQEYGNKMLSKHRRVVCSIKGTMSPRIIVHDNFDECVEHDSVEMDEHHLLQMCQTNDWRNIRTYCDTLTTRILQEQPHSVLDERTTRSSARRQLQATDMWGNTALHAVCYHKPPTYVVDSLIQLANMAFGDCCPFLQPNTYGATPLMIACRSGACQNVLQILLSSPSRTLLPTRLRSVYLTDYGGNTTFSWLVERYIMLSKTPHHEERFWLSLYDSAFSHRDIPGMLLLSTRERSEVGNVSSVDGRILNTLLEEPKVGMDRERDKHTAQLFHELWENIGLLLDDSWNDSTHEASFLLRERLGAGSDDASWLDYPIHATAFVADALPINVMDLLLRLYDKWMSQCTVVHPLHLAVAREQHRDCPAESMSRRTYMIDSLLRIDPKSAQYRMPNSQRYLFHQAIEVGLTWHQLALGTHGPLQSLFRHAPELLTKRDSVTGLYPFQMAATVESALQLDTIYHLLRQAPELLNP